MSIDLSINPAKVTEKITQFIQQTVRNAGFTKLVIGLSGGVDSAVSASLAAHAIGAENIHIGIFPYGQLHKEAVEDAQLVADTLKILQANRHLIDVQKIVDSIVEKVEKGEEVDLLRKGNIAVRTRMILLFDLAKREKALVLGTENKTEYLLGYFTRFGDEASDIEPIYDLYKTQVRELASYLQIPKKIIEKSPTAGMWVGQTDEGEFGFSYEEADQILYLFFDKKLAVAEIEKAGFKKEVIVKVLEHVKKNKFKHELPFVLE